MKSGERVVSLMAVMMWHASRKPLLACMVHGLFSCDARSFVDLFVGLCTMCANISFVLTCTV